ncbi:MAG: Translation initiation factor 2 [Sphingomonas bacterium]|uniref:RcnB family protein n=1 Tax=Sphingomonas bacterium TaxID=1895847 RepID=UPI0026273135|nr:RcnB family protein [Sphingomonas bacterium]MDB5706508.1 Translation initiation factor 2 [Sphingomonas bacterium]
MRTLVIAGLSMVTAISATPAAAQHVLSNGQVWQNGRIVPPATVSPNPPSQSGPGVVWDPAGPAFHNGPIMPANPRPMPMRPVRRLPNGVETGPQHFGGGYNSGPLPGYQPIQAAQRQQRWGGSVGGRWYGGSNAPGGWNAYRRPNRGWTLPRYWIAPSFFISDWGTYGLSTPPQGYNWTRYYDDAVLVDGRGRVMDSVDGIDWDSYDDGQGYGGGGGYAEAGDGYAVAAGGGGGDGYGAGYQQPPMNYAPPPIVQGGGYTTTYSSSGYAGAGGYASGGYWYPPATTTTITVQSAPVVTTTTTEYIEETTSYAPVRRVYRAKRKWRPAPRRSCSCNCCR